MAVIQCPRCGTSVAVVPPAKVRCPNCDYPHGDSRWDREAPMEFRPAPSPAIHRGGEPMAPPQAGDGYLTAAAVLAIAALFIFPIVCGPLAIIFSGIAMSKGNRYGGVVLAISIATMLLGMFFGALVGLSAFG